ncbi:MAG: UDP-N-acetylmuramoyl-L-alanine--D-glutamate ligase [Oscillospiraceae bacterium]|nr:UDP-N-acetylmuramoyl-L-alanine--D-glutamate ligase [Oscillospiraceae bacterium]
MDLQDYLSQLKEKRVTVIGIGVSNTPLIRLLRENDIDVTACDRTPREEMADRAEELEALGAKLVLGQDYLDNLQADVVFRTPGMRPDHPALVKAAEQGSVITSEMEVFFEVCPAPIIAVTGSDGKTTTTTLIAEMLRSCGYQVWLGGNIGKPLLSEVPKMDPDDFAVVELSSFQLMSMRRSPAIAVVTNLSPNHLDVHKSMDEYVEAKENIYRWQGPEDLLVINRDNEITRSFAAKAQGRVRQFSRQETADVWLRDGVIMSDLGGRVRPVLPTQKILIPGIHNVENYMAAIAAVEDFVDDGVIRTFATSFKGVEHRIELVREKDGVKYYNDSIGTSPTRTIAGLNSFGQKVILIAGGYDKHIPFTPLGPVICEKVKTLVLTGDTAEKIRDAVTAAADYQPGAPEIRMIDDFAEAVKTASELAQPGDVVLLSPACAAFDRFKNFAVRGQFFKKLVNEL